VLYRADCGGKPTLMRARKQFRQLFLARELCFYGFGKTGLGVNHKDEFILKQFYVFM
jgi:hypothetical protein